MCRFDTGFPQGYLEMLGRHVGAYAEDNRQRSDKIAIVLR